MAGAMTIQEAMNFCVGMQKNVSYRVPLKVCSIIMASGMKKCFGDQASPDGTAWAKLTERTIARRRKGKRKGGSVQILRDTGVLMNSISSNNAPGAIRRLSDVEAAVGSNVVYAAAHNFGYPPNNLPARTFAGHRPENLPKYEKIFADFEEKRFLKGK